MPRGQRGERRDWRVAAEGQDKGQGRDVWGIVVSVFHSGVPCRERGPVGGVCRRRPASCMRVRRRRARGWE